MLIFGGEQARNTLLITPDEILSELREIKSFVAVSAYFDSGENEGSQRVSGRG